jgi:hypothetical protein
MVTELSQVGTVTVAVPPPTVRTLETTVGVATGRVAVPPPEVMIGTEVMLELTGMETGGL